MLKNRARAVALIGCLGTVACDDARTPPPSGAASAASARGASQPGATQSAPQPQPKGAKAPKGYQAAGLTFRPAEPLPVQEKISGVVPAFEFGIAAESDPKQHVFRVIVAEFPSGAGGPAEKGDVGEMMTIGRSMYLANAKPADSKVERTLLGAKVSGERAKGSIPRPTVSEGYVLERAPKRYVFLGFKYDESFGADRAEKLIASICSSLAKVDG